MNKNILIIGAGMAAFGAANRLADENIRATIYEKRDNYGGHASSHLYDDGFLFDEGPHISFTSNEAIQKRFAANIEDKYETLYAKVNNYWKGYWIKHPAPVNLYGLPKELIIDCIQGFVDASNKDHGEIKNYEEWLLASYGDAFARTFPCEYTKKYHTTDAKNMTVDWVGPRLYKPNLKEILNGALGKDTPDVHYVSNFRYPTNGGFISYMNGMDELANFRYQSEVISIKPVEKTIGFSDGSSAQYDQLISTMPLPQILAMIEGAPTEVIAASKLLACTKAFIVNIGINRPDISDQSWTYIYDDDIVFTRLSFPHQFSPKNVPSGCSSVQVELYFSDKYKPMPENKQAMVDQTIEDLIKVGLIHDKSEIIHASTLVAHWANVIFDLDRPKALSICHGYLDELGIKYAGRYACWDYSWTDQSFISGEEAAQTALEAC